LRALDLKTVDFSPGQPRRSMPLAGTAPTITKVDAKDLTAVPMQPR
jgi:hypothetical protein